MAKFTVELRLPPRELSPNARPHWTLKSKAVKSYREECASTFRLANLPRFISPVIVHLEFYQFRNPALKVLRPRKGVYEFPFAISRDEDNARASFKSGQDSMKDAGVIPDDGRKNVRSGSCTLYSTQKEHQGRTCLVVTIEGELAQ